MPRYILRVCMPARDWHRVSDFVSDIKNSRVIKRIVTRIFPDRPDLDALELVLLIECSKSYVLEIERELASRTCGTIGFFVIYPLTDNSMA
ncbi:MAG: hypothetical protein QW374_01790 [Candidatus Bathyarchaeia archaeon]|nr:hypothetical protein [Candidatus Bathyarchaeota archaeon]